MQLLINNWVAALTAPALSGDLTLSIDPADAARLTGLGSGNYYLLTLAEIVGDVESSWEIVKVTATSGGVLTVERGQEGTTAAAWSVGAGISLRVTAAPLQAALAASAGSGAPAIIGTANPDTAPPVIGAHYLFDSAVFVAVGNSEPEHWVQLTGLPEQDGASAGVGAPVTVSPGRMARLLTVSAYGAPGDALAVVTFTMPAWQASPGDISLLISPEVAGLTTNVDLAFGSSWDLCDIYYSPSSVYTLTRTGNTLSLAVTEGAKFTMHIETYPSGGGTALYVELRAVAAATLIPA